MSGPAAAIDRRILAFIRKPRASDFEPLALDLYAWQYANNLFYRRLSLAEGKRPGIVRSWKDIPAMPAAGFKELVLASFPRRNAVKVFRTSGTTAELKGAHFFDTLKLYEAALVPPFEEFFLRGARGRFFFLMATPKEAPHSSLSHMMGAVNRLSKPAGKFYVKNGTLDSRPLVRDLRAAKGKVFVLSTAFALKGFLDGLKKEGTALKLAPGSRLFETGGFKGRTREVSKAALYAGVRRFLGIPPADCVSEYGMTELSSQCYSEGGRPFRGPAWLRTLVIDPATGREAKKGRPGVLRHFDLANRGSVIAVQTEDLGRAKGSGFELLGRAPGAALRGCSLGYEALLRS